MKTRDPKPSECTCRDIETGERCETLASSGMFAASAHASKCPFFKEWMRRYVELMDELDPSRKKFRSLFKLPLQKKSPKRRERNNVTGN